MIMRRVLMFALLALAACGGSKPPPAPPQAPGVWDEMKWDQQNWQ